MRKEFVSILAVAVMLTLPVSAANVKNVKKKPLAPNPQEISLNYIHTADSNFQNGDSYKAIEYYQKAINSNPNDQAAYIKMAKAYLCTYNPKKALETADLVLKKDAINFEACTIKASILERQKNYTAALASYEQALSAQPDDVYTNVKIGAMRLKLNDKKGAKAYFKKAVSINPGDYRTYVQIANEYNSTNKFSDALKSCYYAQEAIYVNPKNPNAYLSVGDLYIKQGLNKEAKKCFKKAAKLTPKDKDLYLKVANMYWYDSPQKIPYKEVINNLEKAVSINSDIPLEYKLMLIASYTQSGKKNEAQATFKKLMDNNTSK